jgi:hypothetical protein
MAVANCPSCGGPIEFAIGSSVVKVCDYCRSVVARTDVALQDLGKVAALVDTGSPLRRDLPGKYRGVGFRITGRTQMRHEMGGVWDEWYAAFDDGRWGWLAEAMGKFYITFSTHETQLPPFDQLQVGGRFGNMVVQEVGTATLISGEGEIPWRVEPGSTYQYADLSGTQHRFATIDYSEESPLFFAGEETDLKGLGIDVAHEPARKSKLKAERLNCSNCGGALNLVAPDQAERIVCPNCGAMHDVSEGDLRYMEIVELRKKPRIPLGTKGTIDGDEYVVAGWMERSVTYDEKFFWQEYLIFHREKGFRWLIDGDGHWSFAESIPPAEVGDHDKGGGEPAKQVSYGGETYKIFTDAVATVESVVGEFYWKVEVGEQARSTDYIAPPRGISKEISGKGTEREVTYTLAHYLPVEDVEKAFGVSLPRPHGVGQLQPFVAKASTAKLWRRLVMALFVIAIIVAIHSRGREVLSQFFDFSAAPAPTEPPSPQQTANKELSRVIFVAPFHIDGGKNLAIEGYSNVENAYVYVEGDIANEQTGLIDSFELPISYYHGTDSDGSWSEGSRKQTVVLPALPEGNYTMRLEGVYPENISPPRVMIVMRQGVFRWGYFIWALVLITIPAMFIGSKQIGFEVKRWENADYTQSGSRNE